MIRSFTRLEVLKRPRKLLALLAVGAAAAVLAACSSSGTSSTGGGSSSTQSAAGAVGLKTANVGGVMVLTNSKGFTLYSFAPDSSTKSTCNAACAKNWPPVKPGTASATKGAFSTIKRSNGAVQLTYRGHPLYTFIGDKSPGQASGNGINAFGGAWHEATASGSTAPAGSSSPGSGGGGYGY
jgi:predicted lipoprotein with Yx(FWY)xxD motif